MTWVAVIPSSRPESLRRCVKSILRTHPDLSPSRILVLHEGPRVHYSVGLPEEIRWSSTPCPFSFERCVNKGFSLVAPYSAFVIGDDVEVVTPRGLDTIAACASKYRDLAVISAAINGVSGNPAQRQHTGGSLRLEENALSFDCAFFPRWNWEKVGELDEAFTGYGYGDVDYCWRALEENLRLGVADACLVTHGKTSPSAYRARSDIAHLIEVNAARFKDKWKARRTSGQYHLKGMRFPIGHGAERRVPSMRSIGRTPHLERLHRQILRLLKSEPLAYDPRMSPVISESDYQEALRKGRAHPFLDYFLYLYGLVKCLKPRVVVELGTGEGGTALFMLLALGPKGRLFTVDSSSRPRTCLDECIGDRRMQIVEGDDLDLNTYKDTPLPEIDLLFIDTIQRYIQISAEWRLYSPLCSSRAVVALDDIHLNPDMKRFWKELDRPKYDAGRDHHWSGIGLVDIPSGPRPIRKRGK